MIYNSKRVETIQMSINWWVDKQTVLYAYGGILLSHQESLVDATISLNFKNIMLCERINPQKNSYYMIPSIWVV